MAQFQMVVLNGSFAATRTVTDTNAVNTSASSLRVAVDASGNARLVAYTTHNPKSTSQPSTVAVQYFGIAHVYQCLVADTSFTPLGYVAGAKEGSQPFYDAATGRFYLNLIGYRGGQSIPNSSASTIAIGTASLLCDITSSQAITSFAPPSRFRIAACLGEYAPDASNVASSDTFGYAYGNKNPAYRPSVSGTTTLTAGGNIGLLGTRQYSMYILTAYDPSSTNFSIDSYSGGIVGRYDGFSPSETGFACGPNIYATDQRGGSLAAGTYIYTAVWAYKDKEGKAHFSRCAEPVTIVAAGGASKVGLDISVPGISSAVGQLSVQLYRTISGGTQFFRVATQVISTTAASSSTGLVTETYVSFSDQATDATIQSNPLLYRQPGTSGTALDRVSALAGKHVVRHKDRVFYAHESTVYFSSFDVDGEAPWFSPGLSFDVIHGQGPITGLASMDGVLVVFKRDGIYLVDGDGPPENGGAGNEFSPPRKLNVELGCLDPRSIVSIPDGVVYRSQRGIEILTRGLKSQWLGQQIAKTVNANPYVGGCTYNHNTGRMYMVLGSSLGADGAFTFTAVTGLVIVYDTVTTSWTKFVYTNASNVYGNAMQDVCYANAFVTGLGNDNVFLCDHSNTLFCESTATGLDNGNFTPWLISSGWVKAASKQDRIKVTDIFFLGNRYSGHNLTCKYYSDWNKSNATTIRTFDATATNIAPEQLVFQPQKETNQSMKVVLQGVTPTNPTTLGSGQVGEINGITIRVGPKGGGVKLPVAQKG